MYVNRVEVSFDAAHRLLGYEGKCASPHGHTYRAEVFVGLAELDDLGLAIDFGDIKRPLRQWIDDHWDHAFLLNDRDEVLIAALRAVPESKLYLFPNLNPTAEVMARSLFQALPAKLTCVVQSVRIWEAEQSAEYIPSRDGENEGART